MPPSRLLLLLLTVYLSPFLFAACLFALSDAAGCVTGRLYHAEQSSLSGERLSMMVTAGPLLVSRYVHVLLHFTSVKLIFFCLCFVRVLI